MGMKSKFGLLILGCVIVGSALFWYTQKEPYSTEVVVNSVWDKFEVQSIQIGDTDPVIWIDVYNKNDIAEVEKYVKRNLSKGDLEHYEVNVFSNKGKEKGKISLDEDKRNSALISVEMSREESIELAKQVKEDIKNNPGLVMFAKPVYEPLSNEKFLELLNKDELTGEESRAMAKKIEKDRRNNPGMVRYATEVEDEEF